MKHKLVRFILEHPYPLYEALYASQYWKKELTLIDKFRYFILVGKRWGKG